MFAAGLILAVMFLVVWLQSAKYEPLTVGKVSCAIPKALLAVVVCVLVELPLPGIHSTALKVTVAPGTGLPSSSTSSKGSHSTLTP